MFWNFDYGLLCHVWLFFYIYENYGFDFLTFFVFSDDLLYTIKAEYPLLFMAFSRLFFSIILKIPIFHNFPPLFLMISKGGELCDLIYHNEIDL